MTDKHSGTRFLIDTGAEVSVFPARETDKHRASYSSISLQAVNKSPIATYGERSLTLDLGLRRTFRWVFLLTDLPVAIIGADCLRHFGLLVDVKHRRLIDSITNMSVSGILSQSTILSPVFVKS